MERYDVIVVGAGLSGLVAATEAAERGFSVCVLDQEGEQNLGGQAFWSLGGLFFVDSPEQRRMRVRDSLDLARQDWFGSAGFDRPEDHWPRRWAEAYLDFAASEKRAWLHRMGMRWFPVVGWAERGGSLAHGAGRAGASIAGFGAAHSGREGGGEGFGAGGVPSGGVARPFGGRERASGGSQNGKERSPGSGHRAGGLEKPEGRDG